MSRTRAALAAAGLLAVFIGLGAVRTGSAPTAAPGESKAAPPAWKPTKEQWAALTTARVELRVFQPQEIAEGTIAVDDDLTTPIFSPYSGRVVKVLAKLGDAVEAGAPLMAVEASEFVQASNDLVTAVSNLKTASSQLSLAQIAERRQHDLYLANGTALKDWQQSQTDLVAAQNNRRAAEVALAAVRNRLRILGKSDAEIAALEAAPSTQMHPTAYVTSPVRGIVTQRQVAVGENIQSLSAGASTPVYTIGNLSTVWMIAQVREADAARVRINQLMEVTVPAYPSRVFKARVAWIASSIDSNTRRLPVRADVENPDGALKPMMFARFRIMTGEPQAMPAVPIAAILHEGENAHVWVVDENGSLQLREISAGQDDNGSVEILRGLAPGETVVTGGAIFIDRAARGD